PRGAGSGARAVPGNVSADAAAGVGEENRRNARLQTSTQADRGRVEAGGSESDRARTGRVHGAHGKGPDSLLGRYVRSFDCARAGAGIAMRGVSRTLEAHGKRGVRGGVRPVAR